MGSLKRVAGGLFVAIFVFMLVLRPLLRNPAIMAGGVEGMFQWPQLLFYAPLLLVTGGLFLLAALALIRGENGIPMGSRERRAEPAADSRTDREPGEGFWEEEKRKNSVWEETERAEATGDPEITDSEDDSSAPDIPEEYRDHPAISSRFLSGQGGTREQEFGIEAEPPDANLSDHLEHLRTELDDEEVREDLDTLETVVEETEQGHEIPARCPQCDAAWTARTVFGVKNHRYELLDDGTDVICLKCESVHRLEGQGENGG